jgi:hypothetical protein
MPTDDPTTPTPSERLNNRELLHRTIIRIRTDLTRAEKLTRLIGINQPTPPEVFQALQTLHRYTTELIRLGRPGPGRHRPKP